jgi:mRNA interferase HigB
LAWYRHVLKADWDSPATVKADFATASILKDRRVVFNIAGNKYRIVVWINYPYRAVHIRFIGTHAQYDAIDEQTVRKGEPWKSCPSGPRRTTAERLRKSIR